ncbi:MAG: hypothetical protein AAB448_03065 [Patescibacteria group bacterium]|mgnify:CR=1 FL=1
MNYYELISDKEKRLDNKDEDKCIIKIDSKLLKNEEHLYELFSDLFKYRKEGKKNWNKITDGFVDEFRLKKEILYIIHDTEISALALLEKDLESYFFSLFAALAFHNSTDKRTGCLRKDEHFRAIFYYKDENDRKEKELALEKIKENINWK